MAGSPTEIVSVCVAGAALIVSWANRGKGDAKETEGRLTALETSMDAHIKQNVADRMTRLETKYESLEKSMDEVKGSIAEVRAEIAKTADRLETVFKSSLDALAQSFRSLH